MAYIDCVVDTNPMANEINTVSRNIQGTTAAAGRSGHDAAAQAGTTVKRTGMARGTPHKARRKQPHTPFQQKTSARHTFSDETHCHMENNA